MKFSVIIPVYKAEKFLLECVDSILSQTFPDFELLLVEDGSPDHCGELCDRFALQDSRVVVIHKENGGASDARNFGTRIAKGEYITFLDSDDYIVAADFFEKIDAVSKESPDIILYKNKKYYQNSGSFVEENFNLPEIRTTDKKEDVLTRLVAADAFYCAAWLKTIKRTVLTENGIEFQKGIVSEDQEWYYHVIEHSQTFAAINEAFIVYRQREGSVTAAFGDKHLIDTLLLLKGWSDRMLQMEISEKERFALLSSLGKLYANLMIAYSTLSREKQNQYRRQMKELSYLLCYDLNPRTRKVKMVKNVIGFAGVMYVLSLVTKLKRR